MNNYWLCHYFPSMLDKAKEHMTSYDQLKYSLEQAGFKNIRHMPFFVTNQLQDWFLQSGKYRPEIYLDENVRKGISSFQLTSNATEVEQGLKQIKTDIDSGEIQQIIARYESNSGDYLFIAGEKG
jgi:hypothetical protein